MSRANLTISCLAERHDWCNRDSCPCWCHGGVREPRKPLVPSGEVSAQQTTP